MRPGFISTVLVEVSPNCARNRRPSPMPAPSSTVSMKMPQKTPSAVMMLRLRFRRIVCQISFQRSVSKNPVIVWFLILLLSFSYLLFCRS